MTPPPSATLAHGHDTAPLAGLMLGQTPVDPIGLAVGGLHVAAEVGAVDLDMTVQHRARVLRRHRLAQLVGQHERGLVLNVEIAAELERGMALGAVHEDGDRQQVVADRELAAREDRAGRETELSVAAFALEDRPARVLVARHAAALRADRLAIGGGPADRPERCPRLLLRHAGDGREGERPGLG